MKRRNRVNEIADKYGSKGKFDRLRVELDQLTMSELTREEKESWYHTRGIVEFQTGNRKKALEIFEQGVQRFPKSGFLQFSLGQEYEGIGEIDRAVSSWRKVAIREVGSKYILAIARYLYLWGLIEEAENTIQPIFDVYYDLRIVDDHFLYIRGLPFFSVTFGYRAAFSQITNNITRAVSELKRAKKELHDYDFDSIKIDVDAVYSGDWSKVLSQLNEDRSGYTSMRRAVIMSRQSADYESASAHLDLVKLTKEDFRWLNDIRLLAKAEMAYAFGDLKTEGNFLNAFFERQPLLFEPDHAFYFGFLHYQEKLKEKYRALRSRR